jgi:hypothetical protein
MKDFNLTLRNLRVSHTRTLNLLFVHWGPLFILEVYYESIKREAKIRGINKFRCDERLQTKTKEFTRLPYTGFIYYESTKRKLKTLTRTLYESTPFVAVNTNLC